MSIFQGGLFTCGFDMDPAPSDLFTYIAGGASSTTTPYTFGYSWALNAVNTVTGILLNGNLTHHYMGTMFLTTNLPSSHGPMYFWNDVTANATQLSLHVNSTGQLQFYLSDSGSTTIYTASPAGTVVPGIWTYIEAFVVISSTVGQVIARVNNSVVINSPATQNTQNSANTWTNAVGFQSMSIGSGTCYFDDWYMLDGTGSAPFNNFLGKVQCRGDAPNNNSANSARNAWTPTNPQNVNYKNNANIPYNSSEYDADSNVGDYDMFRYPALPGSFTVFAINEWFRLGLDSAGARTVVPNVSSSGVDSAGPAITPPSGGSQLFNQIYAVDPNTSAAWTAIAAQDAELGVKIQS